MPKPKKPQPPPSSPPSPWGLGTVINLNHYANASEFRRILADIAARKAQQSTGGGE